MPVDVPRIAAGAQQVAPLFALAQPTTPERSRDPKPPRVMTTNEDKTSRTHITPSELIDRTLIWEQAHVLHAVIGRVPGQEHEGLLGP